MPSPLAVRVPREVIWIFSISSRACRSAFPVIRAVSPCWTMLPAAVWMVRAPLAELFLIVSVRLIPVPFLLLFAREMLPSSLPMKPMPISRSAFREKV